MTSRRRKHFQVFVPLTCVRFARLRPGLGTLVFSLLTFGFTCAALAAPLGNDDVVRLLGAGVSEETVLRAIELADPPTFDTSAVALIKLKQAGASEIILQKILTRQADRPGVSDRASTPRAGAKGVCRIEGPGGGLYIRADGKILPLQYHVARVETTVKDAVASIFTFGAVKAKGSSIVRIEGAAAAVRIHDKRPVFLDLLFPVGRTSLEKMFYLLRVTTTSNGRLAEMARGEGDAWGNATGEDVADKVRIPVTLEQVAEDCSALGKQWAHYRMKPAAPLEPGEYAYIQGSGDSKSVMVFDFAVE